ncbi:MAG: PKD domain-containing protein [Candidatus Acetothermia bacterium]
MKDNLRLSSSYLFLILLLAGLLFVSGCDGLFNQDPTAKISYDPDSATGNLPLTINFSGSGSSDPEGSIASYDWEFEGQDGEEETSTKENPVRTYDSEGTYNVSLTVTDEDKATDTTSVEVTVSEPEGPPAPP